MTNSDDTAFPIPSVITSHWGYERGTPGLTKREYFAAMAMQGFISGCYAGQNAGFTVQGNVFAAVEYADALIKKLNGENNE